MFHNTESFFPLQYPRSSGSSDSGAWQPVELKNKTWTEAASPLEPGALGCTGAREVPLDEDLHLRARKGFPQEPESCPGQANPFPSCGRIHIRLARIGVPRPLEDW